MDCERDPFPVFKVWASVMMAKAAWVFPQAWHSVGQQNFLAVTEIEF